jgi:hypothetical protein
LIFYLGCLNGLGKKDDVISRIHDTRFKMLDFMGEDFGGDGETIYDTRYMIQDFWE